MKYIIMTNKGIYINKSMYSEYSQDIKSKTLSYNEDGTLNTITYNDGKTITYTYDVDGNLISWTDGNKTWTVNRDVNDRIESIIVTD